MVDRSSPPPGPPTLRPHPFTKLPVSTQILLIVLFATAIAILAFAAASAVLV